MEKFVIVEDNVIQSRLLAKLIFLELGILCDIVSSMKDVQEFMSVNEGNIIGAVVDLVLPDAKNGEVVDYLLEKKVHLIVYTGKYSEEIREKLIAKDIVDYVVKKNTYNLNYVIDLIRRLIKNPKIKVLVVDDSETSRSRLVKYLNVHRYDVYEVTNGYEALEMLKKHRDMSLVITDYLMPRMDGLELVTKIRMDFSKYKMSVIGISGHAKETISVRFLKNGANDFLLKPFSKEEFYCRVTQNIEYLERCNLPK